jgi:hypothetical protein
VGILKNLLFNQRPLAAKRSTVRLKPDHNQSGPDSQGDPKFAEKWAEIQTPDEGLFPGFISGL